jgi:outer membrane lipoprotein-sorting protein
VHCFNRGSCGSFRNAFTLVLSLLLLAAQGCVVKKTVKVPTAPKVALAKNATLDELLNGLESSAEHVSSLVSNAMRVTFTSGRVESGKLQEYRSAPGYILLKRPDSIRLNVQNPITKTSIVELVSVGDEFGVWYPRDNKFFVGRNSARELEVEGAPTFSARPSHIFEAIFPQKIAFRERGYRISLEEDRDSTTKYYILTLFRDAGDQKLEPVRKLWIDRSDLAVTRQFVYGEHGVVVSMIEYSNLAPTDGVLLPLSIRIERPVDGYILDMKFTSWRVNSDLPDSAFVMNPPSGAQKVVLKEKGRG